MSWLDDVGRTISGTVDPNKQMDMARSVQPADPNAFNLQGAGEYAQSMNGLAGQMPQATDYVSPNAGDTQQQQMLRDYFQNVALGKQPTAANQMFQNAEQSNARQMQSSMVSAGGMNPALGMRQMMNGQASTQGQLAGQGAAQKLQEQQGAAQFAQQGSQALVAQRMAQMQQNYTEQMQGIRTRQDIAQGLFNANRDQTNLNVERAKNQQAYQTFMYQAQMQAEKDQAQSHTALIKMLMGAGTAAAGVGLMAFGGPAGGAAGMGVGQMLGMGALSGGLGMMGGGSGGAQQFNPAMMQMLMQGQGGNPLQSNINRSNANIAGGTADPTGMNMNGGGYKDPYGDVYANQPALNQAIPGGGTMSQSY